MRYSSLVQYETTASTEVMKTSTTTNVEVSLVKTDADAIAMSATTTTIQPCHRIGVQPQPNLRLLNHGSIPLGRSSRSKQYP